jgi:hypothetical protein
MTFLDKCITGNVSEEAIHDFIDEWHTGESSLALHEFLGMTWDEYVLWVVDAKNLRKIIDARK